MRLGPRQLDRTLLHRQRLLERARGRVEAILAS
jgi:hypothetical protein